MINTDRFKDLYMLDQSGSEEDEDNLRDYDDIETIVRDKFDDIERLVKSVPKEDVCKDMSEEEARRYITYKVCRQMYNMNLYIHDFHLSSLCTTLSNIEIDEILDFINGYKYNFIFHLSWSIPYKSIACIGGQCYFDDYYSLQFYYTPFGLGTYVDTFIKSLYNVYNNKTTYTSIHDFTQALYTVRDILVRDVINTISKEYTERFENDEDAEDAEETIIHIRENLTSYIKSFIDVNFINHIINFYSKQYAIYPVFNISPNIDVLKTYVHYYNFNNDDLKLYIIPQGWDYRYEEELIEVFLSNICNKCCDFFDHIIMNMYTHEVRKDAYLFV